MSNKHLSTFLKKKIMLSKAAISLTPDIQNLKYTAMGGWKNQ